MSTCQVLVTLSDGSRVRYFDFVPPPPQKWKSQNGEFLIGYPTELKAPFDKVFIKRLKAKPIAHDLLVKLIGRGVSGTPRVFGYVNDGRDHIYVFENLPSRYKVLESQLTNSHIICPETVRAVATQAKYTVKEMLEYGYMYTDFCAKNIMIDNITKRVRFIDVDSAWTVARLSKTVQPKGDEFKINYWGLLNEYVSLSAPNKLEAVGRTMVMSFVAVWSRAIMLANHATKPDRHAAGNLVKNPSVVHQRALWDSLKNKNRLGVIEYFGLSDSNGDAVYNQWQRMFDDLRDGRELPWEELNSATDNLLTAIEETQKPEVKPVKPTFVLKPVGTDPARQSWVQTPGEPQVPTLPLSKPPVVIQPQVLTPPATPVVTVPTPKTALPGADKGDGHINAFARGVAKGFRRFLKPPLPYRR